MRTRLEGPRGALSAQTLQAHESALSPEALMTWFNAVAKAMARRGLFPKKARTSLDPTGVEVVPTFMEAGVVKKKVKVVSKARRPRQLEVSVRGFNVWFLMEVETGLPLAMTVDAIETAETVPAKALLDQARESPGKHGRIVSVALDRGFLDGDLLWWLSKSRGIDWVCPSKAIATVVLSWPDRHAQDKKDECDHDVEAKGPVVLLSCSNEPGFVCFDRYDERSLIESRCNRDAKQHFGLGTTLARNLQAFWSAAVQSTVALMMYRGLPLHRERVQEEAERRGEALGVLRYRRQQRILNRDRVIVVVKEHYGIFTLFELASLLGAEFH